MFVVVVEIVGPQAQSSAAPSGAYLAQVVSAAGSPQGGPQTLNTAELAAFIRDRTRAARAAGVAPPRWVFERGATVFPALLSADPALPMPYVHDLRLVQAILAQAATAPGSGVTYRPVLPPLPDGEHPGIAPDPPVRSAWNAPGENQLGLFDDITAGDTATGPDTEERLRRAVSEFSAQLLAVDQARSPGRLRLLAALESTGALLAADMHRVGVAWDTQVHRALLEEALGPEPAPGQRPARMEAAARRLREALVAPALNPDSPQSLLRALRDAGIPVDSTSQWLLKGWVEAAPASSPDERARREALIAPVMEYKKMSRLLTANGWHWLANWVHDDRFHAEYVVGGVVTGRWAARGGGALQIPRAVRSAVRPGAGRRLVVADAAQLEPRVLAVLARDDALADASRGRDLYLAIAEQGRTQNSGLTERTHAKIALLGAMYGATTGDSGRLMPHLTRMFPKAVAYVEHAARVGEDGGQVCTWLGRWSPAPSQEWQARTADTATAAGERAAQSMRRTHGRFTRNFVVQGSAAEWAMAWMGRVRTVLMREDLDARLVFFLHDEIMVDTADHQAPQVERIVREAAEEATRIVFGKVPVDFPVSVVTVDSYDQAK
ncbi:bifunctional 3'-5' exonuclease/DNA polymerase [Kocuria coralli]|uniref:bifunctional 3'-5' exonuclease/DNA polymerase n=1 Tax=Kocuria coralli TaxID=1461025 RepID=UPI001FEC0BEE|nr:bifunctional 3'-5' exonuclease/DNA polymerase [Kocuria coralli]